MLHRCHMIIMQIALITALLNLREQLPFDVDGELRRHAHLRDATIEIAALLFTEQLHILACMSTVD